MLTRIVVLREQTDRRPRGATRWISLTAICHQDPISCEVHLVQLAVQRSPSHRLAQRERNGCGDIPSAGERDAPLAEPSDDEEKAVVTISYERTGTGSDEYNYLEIDPGESKPGRYEIAVAITDLNGAQTAEKTVMFFISE